MKPGSDGIVSPIVREVGVDRWDMECVDEHLWWPRILWTDPGVVSGVAVVWFDPQALLVDRKPLPRCVLAWWEGYVSGPEAEQVDTFLDIGRQLSVQKTGAEEGEPISQSVGLATGIESFVPRQLNMSAEFLAPVRLRSAYEYAIRPGKLHLQTPTDALTSVTDARLKLWDMYTPGPDHIRDATRHCLLWIKKLRSHRDWQNMLRRTHGWESGWFTGI